MTIKITHPTVVWYRGVYGLIFVIGMVWIVIQAQKLYNEGVNLYRLGTLGQPGINVKEALKHNFQGLVVGSSL
jgi:hypothetical protein